MSALLMAIYFNGLTKEQVNLTYKYFKAESNRLSSLEGIRLINIQLVE